MKKFLAASLAVFVWLMIFDHLLSNAVLGSAMASIPGVKADYSAVWEAVGDLMQCSGPVRLLWARPDRIRRGLVGRSRLRRVRWNPHELPDVAQRDQLLWLAVPDGMAPHDHCHPHLRCCWRDCRDRLQSDGRAAASGLKGPFGILTSFGQAFAVCAVCAPQAAKGGTPVGDVARLRADSPRSGEKR